MKSSRGGRCLFFDRWFGYLFVFVRGQNSCTFGRFLQDIKHAAFHMPFDADPRFSRISKFLDGIQILMYSSRTDFFLKNKIVIIGCIFQNLRW